MDKQNILTEFKEFQFNQIKKLEVKKNHLELEKKRFIEFIACFIAFLDFKQEYIFGRPKIDIRDIIISLLVMSYNQTSYKRTKSDLIELKNKRIIERIPKKSTLCNYMNSKETKKIIEDLIHHTSLFFLERENTIILDSTWMSTRMYTGGYQVVHKKKSHLENCRKLHIAILKDSKIISHAITSDGKANDSPFFNELVGTTIKNGFKIDTLLADAGYCSKSNYAFADGLAIRYTFIDFKKNCKLEHAKSKLWKRQLELFKNRPHLWKEEYRFRVLVESVFSIIKRKQRNYLRTKNKTAQEVELLLKALVYNFTVVCKYI